MTNKLLHQGQVINLDHVYKAIVSIPGWADLLANERAKSGNYGRSSWAYRTIRLRCDALSSIPWRLTRDGQEVENSALEMILENSDLSELVEGTELDLLTVGAGYWERLIVSGTLVALRRLNARTMTVKSNKDGIVGFVQHLDGKDIPLSVEDVIYFREPSPVDDLGPGVPALSTCKKAIEIELAAEAYLESFFLNSAMPSVLLHSDQAIPPKEGKRILRWWKSRFGGDKQNSVGIADRGLKAQVLSFPIDELALDEIRAECRRSICASMGVPEVLVGSRPSENYAAQREIRKAFYEDTVFARAEQFADVINAQLAEVFGVTFEWEFDQVPAMREDQDKLHERIGGLVDRGILTPIAAARELGYDEADVPQETNAEGDEFDLMGDLNRWRRKALKRLKRNGSARCDFESRIIPELLSEAIDEQLAAAKTAEEVTRIFENACS